MCITGFSKKRVLVEFCGALLLVCSLGGCMTNDSTLIVSGCVDQFDRSIEGDVYLTINGERKPCGEEGASFTVPADIREVAVEAEVSDDYINITPPITLSRGASSMAIVRFHRKYRMFVHAKNAECEGIPNALVSYRENELGFTNDQGIFEHKMYDPLPVGSSFHFEIELDGRVVSTEVAAIRNNMLTYNVDGYFADDEGAECNQSTFVIDDPPSDPFAEDTPNGSLLAEDEPVEPAPTRDRVVTPEPVRDPISTRPVAVETPPDPVVEESPPDEPENAGAEDPVFSVPMIDAPASVSFAAEYEAAEQLYYENNIGEAIQTYLFILDRDPNQYSAILNLATLYYENNRLDQAFGYAQQISGLTNLIPKSERKTTALRAAYLIAKIQQTRYEQETNPSNKQDLGIIAHRSLQYFMDLKPNADNAGYADLDQIHTDIQRILGEIR